MIEVIIYLVEIQCCRQAVVMQGQLSQMVAVILQGALAAPGQSDFLVELLVKFPKTCYISAGCVNGVCFFLIMLKHL